MSTLIQAIYERLFSLVVKRVNTAVVVNFPPHRTKTVISVLDIYGFEVFGVNGFEQFCINYCNEKLQQLFINLVLEQEQEEYKLEGIQWVDIPFSDNTPICEMIEIYPDVSALIKNPIINLLRGHFPQRVSLLSLMKLA